MKTNWVCPKCKKMITTHIKTYPPICYNAKAHCSVGAQMEESNATTRKAIQGTASPVTDQRE